MYTEIHQKKKKNISNVKLLGKKMGLSKNSELVDLTILCSFSSLLPVTLGLARVPAPDPSLVSVAVGTSTLASRKPHSGPTSSCF